MDSLIQLNKIEKQREFHNRFYWILQCKWDYFLEGDCRLTNQFLPSFQIQFCWPQHFVFSNHFYMSLQSACRTFSRICISKREKPRRLSSASVSPFFNLTFHFLVSLHFHYFLQYKFDWKWVLCRFVELCKTNSSVFNFSWTQLKFCFRPLFLLITNDGFSPQQNTTFHLRFIFHWLTLHSNSFVSAQSFESFLFFEIFVFICKLFFLKLNVIPCTHLTNLFAWKNNNANVCLSVWERFELIFIRILVVEFTYFLFSSFLYVLIYSFYLFFSLHSFGFEFVSENTQT